MRSLLPLALPLSVLLIGSWRLAVTSKSPHSAEVLIQKEKQQPLPDLTVPPPGTGITCDQDPSLDQDLLVEGQRLGIKVISGTPQLKGKDGTYRAEPGRFGTITLKPRPMSAEVRCKLISHEFIHVLQHIHGDLRGVPTLAWPASAELIELTGSRQEAEAYQHQNRVGYVLRMLRAVPTLS
ncbi:hypothetical protein PMIT1313_00580 [Prochlorococcus marinus str. MIT 1313]|uniref:hypothetical protein n=1 Tax=Prochlorococcus TaxID=1218 RepID=UPI0007B352FF|nr:hypothetical protein [Prochlorococcus marinus]KZR70270.1 hypothetical protein PMIT1313_00580 [Prochlorococcus marinus str. MIT 1313]KZR70742.1 hypothetical protein PMIT1318_01882 [Prochlorococcus marinus str. MIT 1318]